jgi:dTDP-glucose pyrophosphorylase
MHPLTQHVPKPLLPICNRPLVERHIEMLKGCGVRRVIVVIGHLGQQFRELLGTGQRLGVEIEYVEQPRAEGIGHALGLLADRVQAPMIVVLGDIYFVAADLRPAVQLVTEGRAEATLLSKQVEARAEIKKNFEIWARPDGRVERVVEKPAEPTCNIKGCGLYVFSPSIFEAIEKTPRSELRNEYELTDAIQILVHSGAAVHHAPLIHADINLTSPADLLLANLAELQRQGRESVIGERVQMEAGAQVSASVLGAGVRVRRPIRIERSVVLAETDVSVSTDIVSAVVGAAGIVSC